ncbi:hypothetical protein, partial [Crossiella sp. NPDC003009]
MWWISHAIAGPSPPVAAPPERPRTTWYAAVPASDYLMRDLAERLRSQIAVAEDLCRRMNEVLD